MMSCAFRLTEALLTTWTSKSIQLSGHCAYIPNQHEVTFQVQATSKPEEVWITENFLPSSKAAK